MGVIEVGCDVMINEEDLIYFVMSEKCELTDELINCKDADMASDIKLKLFYLNELIEKWNNL